jgi:hypothetical protein
VAPFMFWMVCFMATVLPFQSSSQAMRNFYSLLVGLAVSASVLLFIFPKNYSRLFISNTNRITQLLGKGMEEVRRYLLKQRGINNFDDLPFVKIVGSLNQMLSSNQGIEDNGIFHEQQKIIDNSLIHFYVLVNAYTMMLESYRVIHKRSFSLSRSTIYRLSIMSKAFSRLYYSIKINSEFSFEYTEQQINLPLMSKIFEGESLTEPALIIALMNLNLSFNLMNYHIKELAGIKHGT